MDNVWLIIPTGNRTQYLQDIFNESGILEDKRIIVRTIKNQEPIPNAINLEYDGEFNIHKWWNMGINHAQNNGAEYVAVLNDDIQILDNPFHKIVEVMKSTKAPLGYPFPFVGHVCGYCWVLDIKSPIRPNEKYVWWYGDRDLDLQARLNGGVVHVPAMVRHIHGNELTRSSVELMEITKKDEQLFLETWNKG